MKKRDYCYKRAKRTSINWCEYKRLRNSTNAAVKRAKDSYHKSPVEEHSKDNPKAFLRTIKKLLPDPDKNPSTALRINYEVITCPTRGPQSEHVGTGSCELELISKVDCI